MTANIVVSVIMWSCHHSTSCNQKQPCNWRFFQIYTFLFPHTIRLNWRNSFTIIHVREILFLLEVVIHSIFVGNVSCFDKVACWTHNGKNFAMLGGQHIVFLLLSCLLGGREGGRRTCDNLKGSVQREEGKYREVARVIAKTELLRFKRVNNQSYRGKRLMKLCDDWKLLWLWITCRRTACTIWNKHPSRVYWKLYNLFRLYVEGDI